MMRMVTLDGVAKCTVPSRCAMCLAAHEQKWQGFTRKTPMDWQGTDAAYMVQDVAMFLAAHVLHVSNLTKIALGLPGCVVLCIYQTLFAPCQAAIELAHGCEKEMSLEKLVVAVLSMGVVAGYQAAEGFAGEKLRPIALDQQVVLVGSMEGKFATFQAVYPDLFMSQQVILDLVPAANNTQIPSGNGAGKEHQVHQALYRFQMRSDVVSPMGLVGGVDSTKT